MATEEEVGKAQTWWATCDDYTIERDSMFKLFKRPELDATIAAASSGKFADYWTIDRLSELNNAVDASHDCHSELKALFAAGSSKNIRLRANRLGQMILNHALELSNSGPSISSSSNSSVPPSSPARGPAQSSAALSSTPKRDQLSSAQPVKMQRYEFAPGLPADCRLRVRSRPDISGDELGIVTVDDEIYATKQEGDWIQVHLADNGVTQEGWMLVATADTLLLVPSNEPPVVTSSFTTEPSIRPATAPPPQQQYQPPIQQQQQQQQQQQYSSGGPSLSNTMQPQYYQQQQPLVSQSVPAYGMMDTTSQFGTVNLNNTMSGMSQQNMIEQLERRVAMLETELTRMKALFHSV